MKSMTEIDGFVIGKIFRSFKRHIFDKFNDITIECISTPRGDEIKMSVVFNHNGIIRSFGIMLRKNNIIEDFSYQLFKLADSRDVEGALVEMIGQWKQIQDKPQ